MSTKSKAGSRRGRAPKTSRVLVEANDDVLLQQSLLDSFSHGDSVTTHSYRQSKDGETRKRLIAEVEDVMNKVNHSLRAKNVKALPPLMLSSLCLHQYNTDLILATPVDTLNKLCQTLASSFYKPYEQEMREMSISIIYYMVSASTIWSLTISQTTHTIPLLISFIEKAEETAQSVVSYQ